MIEEEKKGIINKPLIHYLKDDVKKGPIKENEMCD